MEDIDDILAKIDDDYRSQAPPEEARDEVNILLDEYEKKQSGEKSPEKHKEPVAESAPVQEIEKPDASVNEHAPDSTPGEITEPVEYPAESAQTSFLPAGQSASIFTVRGTKSWNNKEPYVIKIDHESIDREKAELQKSFFFASEPVSPEALNETLKRAIIQYMRRPSDTINDRYEDFVFRSVISVVEEISELYSLDEDSKFLFIYHSGPQTIFNIVYKTLALNNYGFCYKYLTNSKASRFLPKEIIKEKVLVWFEENINCLNIQFDSLQAHDAVKAMVMKKYQTALGVFNARYNELNKKIAPKRSISRDKLLHLKGDQWFGIVQLELFKRFVGKSIFI